MLGRFSAAHAFKATIALAMWVSIVCVLAFDARGYDVANADEAEKAIVPDRVSGHWDGTWTYGVYSGRFELSLRAVGKKVEGKYNFYGGSGGSFLDVPVVGTADGDTILLTMPSIAHGRIEGTSNGDTMTGTYLGRTQLPTKFMIKRIGPRT